MKFNVRQPRLTFLLAFVVLTGLTAYAYRAGSLVTPRNDIHQPPGTRTNAAAVTQVDLLPKPAKVPTEETALEPLQSGGTFNLPQSVIASGGGQSTGGNNAVTGTVGQSAVGASSGGNYSVQGGFWPNGTSGGGCPSIFLTPSTLTAGMAGTPYPTTTLMPSGGTSPYSFTIPVGALPTGMNLSSGGVLDGTPTSFGTFNFTVRATDSANCLGEQAYSLVINSPCGTVTVNPASLANGFVGTLYSQSLSATGGTAPYTFTVIAGSLPDGLNLVAASVTGTPTATGVFTFTIKATDNLGCTGTRSYTVVISGTGLQFYPLPVPVRLLDTRSGQTACSAPGAPITGGTALTQNARNFCGIPASAKAVTGNVTVVLPGANGFLTIYPSDAATQPTAANTNFAAGDVLNNVFTVGLGAADGAFKMFASTTVESVVDITGYYAPPGTGGLFFHPLPKPIRLLETRASQPGCFTPGTQLTANTDTTEQGTTSCDGVTIPPTALALVGNATTVFPSANGFITLYPANAASRPLAASGNYRASTVLNSPFTVGLSPAGQFKIYTVATTDVVIDVLGYFSADAVDGNGTGLLFNPLTPARLLDTRTGQPACFTPSAALPGGGESLQAARGVCTIASTAQAIVGNATTVLPSANGFLTFWPSDAISRPLAATSNYQASRNFNRYYTVGLGTDGAFKMYTAATTNLVVDVSGYFAP